MVETVICVDHYSTVRVWHVHVADPHALNGERDVATSDAETSVARIAHNPGGVSAMGTQLNPVRLAQCV